MKPYSRRILPSSNLLQAISTGPVIAKIKGSVKKLGQQHQNATVVLYNKANLQPIAVRRLDQDGSYQFLGLNTDLKIFIAVFDKNQQFNAVIQDNVVPK